MTSFAIPLISTLILFAFVFVGGGGGTAIFLSLSGDALLIYTGGGPWG